MPKHSLTGFTHLAAQKILVGKRYPLAKTLRATPVPKAAHIGQFLRHAVRCRGIEINSPLEADHFRHERRKLSDGNIFSGSDVDERQLVWSDHRSKLLLGQRHQKNAGIRQVVASNRAKKSSEIENFEEDRLALAKALTWNISRIYIIIYFGFALPEHAMDARHKSTATKRKSLLFKFKDDTLTTVSHETFSKVTKKLGFNETQTLHLAIARLRDEVLGSRQNRSRDAEEPYPPLTAAQLLDIRSRARKPGGKLVRKESLF